MDLDYYLWSEHDGERKRFMWEVVEILIGGGERHIAGGIEDTREIAMRAIGSAMRAA